MRHGDVSEDGETAVKACNVFREATAQSAAFKRCSTVNYGIDFDTLYLPDL